MITFLTLLGLLNVAVAFYFWRLARKRKKFLSQAERDLEQLSVRLETQHVELHNTRQQLVEKTQTPQLHQSVFEALEQVKAAARDFDHRCLVTAGKLVQNPGTQDAVVATDIQLRDRLSNVSFQLAKALREIQGEAPP